MPHGDVLTMVTVRYFGLYCIIGAQVEALNSLANVRPSRTRPGQQTVTAASMPVTDTEEAGASGPCWRRSEVSASQSCSALATPGLFALFLTHDLE